MFYGLVLLAVLFCTTGFPYALRMAPETGSESLEKIERGPMPNRAPA